MARQEFIAHAFYVDSAFSGYELQISDCGEAARYRFYIIGKLNVIGFWQPVRYDRYGNAYIRDWHGNVPVGKPNRTFKKLKFENFIKYRK